MEYSHQARTPTRRALRWPRNASTKLHDIISQLLRPVDPVYVDRRVRNRSASGDGSSVMVKIALHRTNPSFEQANRLMKNDRQIALRCFRHDPLQWVAAPNIRCHVSDGTSPD